MPLGNKPFENTVGKGEIAHNEQFLLFPQCFLPVWITFCRFRQIWNCRLQTPSSWKSINFVVWEKVKLQILTLTELQFCLRVIFRQWILGMQNAWTRITGSKGHDLQKSTITFWLMTSLRGLDNSVFYIVLSWLIELLLPYLLPQETSLPQRLLTTYPWGQKETLIKVESV